MSTTHRSSPLSHYPPQTLSSYQYQRPHRPPPPPPPPPAPASPPQQASPLHKPKQKAHTKWYRNPYILTPTSLLLLTLIAILSYFLILPHIIQAQLEQTTIKPLTLQIRNTHTNGFHLHMNLEIHASPILAATINQIPKLHVQYAGQELGYITLPETNIPRGKGSTILKFESPFTITNQDAFRTFNEDLITKAQFVWTLNAPVSVKILKMNFHKLSFNKKIVLKGMDNFPDTRIISQSLPSYNANGGIDLSVKVNMTNRSPISLELGTLALGIRVNGSVLGQLYSQPNFTLVSGVNIITLNGSLSCCRDSVCEPLVNNTIVNRHRSCNAIESQVLATFFSRYLAGIPSEVITNGLFVLPSTTWLNDAVQNIQLKVMFGSKKVWPVDNLKVQALKLYPGTPDWESKSLATLSATFTLPEECGFNVNITEMQANLNVYNDVDLIMGRMKPIAWAPCSMIGQSIDVTMQSTIVLEPRARASFGRFLQSCLTEDDLGITVLGAMSAKVNMFTEATTGSGMGTLEIADVDVLQSARLIGMNNFRSRPVMVGALRLTRGSTQGLHFVSTADMYNAGTIEVEASEPSYFDIMYQALNGTSPALVGHLTIPNLVLNQGNNIVRVEGTVLPPSSGSEGWARREFLSAYTQGKRLTIYVSGREDSTVSPSVHLAMSTMYVPSIVTGIPPTLVQSMQIVVSRFLPKIRVWMSNPFDIPMFLGSFQSVATYWSQGRSIVMTTINADLNTVIGGKATKSVDLPLPWVKPWAISMRVNLTATTVMTMGDFTATVDYVQNDVYIRVLR